MKICNHTSMLTKWRETDRNLSTRPSSVITSNEAIATALARGFPPNVLKEYSKAYGHNSVRSVELWLNHSGYLAPTKLQIMTTQYEMRSGIIFVTPAQNRCPGNETSENVSSQGLIVRIKQDYECQPSMWPWLKAEHYLLICKDSADRNHSTAQCFSKNLKARSKY